MSISRRYRPGAFRDIVAQEAVKETLRREVAGKKIGHAYLFSGPRGVGKTTAARIFAKALNCTAPQDGEPCDACSSCQQFREGRIVDVIEIDAASHTGVDMIREAIIEHVRFAPSVSAFKVYILDEAHMLSTAAWNALLKTLEEPPSYAVFILATTELHRVPATIVSRCQRFDFKRLTLEELSSRIRSLAEQEGATVAPEVVATVARLADGCARDAETLLDQLLALGEKKITPDVASLVLPISRLPLAAGILKIAATRNLAAVLSEVGRLEDEGVPFVPLFDDLVRGVRALLLIAEDERALADLKKGDEGERALAELRGLFTPAELSDMALLFMERRRDAKQGIDARFALELACTAIALGVLPHGPNVATDPKPPQTPPAPPSAPAPSAPPKSVPPAPVAPQTPSPSLSSPVSAPSPAPAPAPVASPAAAAPIVDHGEPVVPLSMVLGRWDTFVRAIGEQNASLTFILSVTRPVDVRGSVVVFQFQYPFHRDKIVSDGKNRKVIEETLARICEVPRLAVEAVIGEDTGSAERRSNDTVTNILKAFGGQLVDEGSAG